jgi:hypothetical protein
MKSQGSKGDRSMRKRASRSPVRTNIKEISTGLLAQTRQQID